MLRFIYNIGTFFFSRYSSVDAYDFQFYANEIGTERRDGWGSAEATEMVLNNIFYITAKVTCHF